MSFVNVDISVGFFDKIFHIYLVNMPNKDVLKNRIASVYELFYCKTQV